MSRRDSLRVSSSLSLTSLGNSLSSTSLLYAIDDDVPGTSGLRPENQVPFGDSLYDVVAFIIHCDIHQRLAIISSERACWFPFIAMNTNHSYEENGNNGLQMILRYNNENSEALSQLKLDYLQVYRCQLPQSLKFITRVLYYCKIEKYLERSDFKCCQQYKKISWVPIVNIQNNQYENIWGIELIQASKYIVEPKSPLLINFTAINEQSLLYALFFMPRDKPKNIEEAALKSLNLTEVDIERIYYDFVKHCFPAFGMTLTSFNEYFNKIGIPLNKDIRLFNAFNYNRNGWLTFHEFLMGIACYEPEGMHDENRVKFIFRYYDTDKDGYLTVDELIQMTMDINPNDDNQEILAKTKETVIRFGTDNRIPFQKFSQAIGQKKYRGTSSLVRSKQTIFNRISSRQADRAKNQYEFRASVKKRYKGICPSCRRKKYKLATNIMTVELTKQGPNSYATINPMMMNIETDDDPEKDLAKKHSIEKIGNRTYIANYMLETIRKFNLIKGTHTNPFGLGSVGKEKERFVVLVKELCNEVERVFVGEERAVKVSSPCFVIGDIHGNIEDLLTYERMLWPLIPMVTNNFVFLGDYVDRGKWSVECVLYIFSLKVIAPEKFFFCRGNHEVRQIQELFTFQKECFGKYGPKYGMKIFDMLNHVFDKMPLSCVIDESIFCCHGGIPASTKKLEDINQIPISLSVPESQSPIAWEVS